MNQKLKTVMLLILCVILTGCTKEQTEIPAIDSSNVISEGISTISLNGYGKTIQINDADKIEEIMSVIENIAFEPADSDASVEAPGAITVTVTLGYQDGSKQEITYPYYLYDGNTYITDETSILSFDKYFNKVVK